MLHHFSVIKVSKHWECQERYHLPEGRPTWLSGAPVLAEQWEQHGAALAPEGARARSYHQALSAVAQPPICTLLLHSRHTGGPDICRDGGTEGKWPRKGAPVSWASARTAGDWEHGLSCQESIPHPHACIISSPQEIRVSVPQVLVDLRSPTPHSVKKKQISQHKLQQYCYK